MIHVNIMTLAYLKNEDNRNKELLFSEGKTQISCTIVQVMQHYVLQNKWEQKNRMYYKLCI